MPSSEIVTTSVRVPVESSLQDRQFQRGRDESLLRAVVQVALDPPSCVVGGFDEASA
jgi:hypothetical protein